VLQTEEEAREELATLFPDTAEVEAWLAKMPLRGPEVLTPQGGEQGRSLEKQPT
jgi:hypothetical protein